MKKVMKNLALLSTLLSATFHAAAAPAWGPLELISSIESSPSGLFIASPSYGACGSVQTKVVLTDSQAIKHLYATALTAYSTGRPVRLLTDGCDGPYHRLLGITF